MIRRTLQGGLLAAVTMLALVPAAAVAAQGDRAAPATVVASVAQSPHTLPAPVRHVPARQRAHRLASCYRSIGHGSRLRHLGRVGHLGYACHLRHMPRTSYSHRIHSGTRTAYHHRIGYAAYRHHAYRHQACRHHAYRVAGRVVTRHVPLNIRSGPGTGYRVVGHRHAHARLLLVCERSGSYVHGNRGWYRLAGGRGYVSAHYVRTRSAVPWC
ncbi:SH3 domain-containing protein [Streptomyces glomeratus]|uniref:SH3b domain-containing protein n=1 Tax=Streptomyces glomeratus TaxID=284452 RepID=A0ABP6LSQ2_9ACTN|nr:hypothetical protein [Streptomyces glomeratus]MCF1509152.1 hypothetical protein [Streptomyces glomeratus]